MEAQVASHPVYFVPQDVRTKSATRYRHGRGPIAGDPFSGRRASRTRRPQLFRMTPFTFHSTNLQSLLLSRFPFDHCPPTFLARRPLPFTSTRSFPCAIPMHGSRKQLVHPRNNSIHADQTTQAGLPPAIAVDSHSASSQRYHQYTSTKLQRPHIAESRGRGRREQRRGCLSV
jgi:hypothetical protein